MDADLLNGLAGEYRQASWRPPRWMVWAGGVFVVFIAALNAAFGRWVQALLLLIVIAAVVISFRRRAADPAATRLDPDGVSVRTPYRQARTASWEQVRGVRVFSRASVLPQLLLEGGEVLQLPGLDNAMATRLATALQQAHPGRVRYLLDGRESPPPQ